MVCVPPRSPNRRTLTWLDACDRSLVVADQTALSSARRGRASAHDIAVIRRRIAALRAEIADWRDRLVKPGRDVDPPWMEQLTPWCPPPPREIED